MGTIRQLESVVKGLTAIAQLLETETIDSKGAAKAIRKAIEQINS